MTHPNERDPSTDEAPEQSDVTLLLHAWKSGDDDALDRLLPMVYDELRRLARHQMYGEAPAITLQPTALVNEAYLRLVDSHVEWQDRAHFMAVAARAMRRILVDRARRRAAQKRGSGEVGLSIDDIDIAAGSGEDLLVLEDALEALSKVDERKAKVIELRYFGGLTIEETCHVLGVSHGTVERDMKLAKAWLASRMRAS